MDMIYAVPLALVIGLVGWYLHTTYLAFIDGVRNETVMKAAWWPCFKASSFEEKVRLLEFTIKTYTESNDIHIQAFSLDCAVVVYNNIKRRHPDVVLNIVIQDQPFNEHVQAFNKKHKRSTE